MKRLFVVLLMALFLMGACGNNKGPTQEQDVTPPPAKEPVVDSTTNQSEPDAINDSAFLPLEVKESGFTMRGDYLYCAVILHNPNEDYCVEFPTFRIVARDSEGLLLGTQDQVLSIIYPQQDFCYASLAFEVEEVPATVDFEVVSPEDYNIEKIDLVEHPDFQQLTVVNTAIRGDRVLGEIENSNSYDIDDTIVTIVFRDEDGHITYGTSTFPDGVPASGSTPFDMSIDENFVTDYYEVYANIW